MIDDDDKPRDAATDKIIKAALAEEGRAKRARKMEKDGLPADTKDPAGKTLAEIEDEETGGTVKESLVGMAQVKRAGKRKAKDAKSVDADDLELPADVDKFEQEAAVEEEDGVKFMPFNLNEEREEGDFDESGNYVERKNDEEKDAWMDSHEAKVVSEEVRAKIAAREAAAAKEASVRQAPLTDRQIATLKMEIAELMKEGESITRALKRLGAKRAMGKRDRQRMEAAGTAGAPVEADRLSFERMTEVADQLLVEGEADVYSTSKEELEKSAAMWLPKSTPASAPAAPVPAAPKPSPGPPPPAPGV
eukprot:gene9846-7733_t